ncbi:hypothetical protein B0H21DRAFT_824475 [Amylocystis lapponica]|nr:hypothetical protein B0H21DRAFT_824475 [Amylocystis lapponica]
MPTLYADCAVVQRFMEGPEIPELPWSLRATDLGIATWHADQLADAEVVEVCCLSGQFALATISKDAMRLWVTISLDHDTQEPDILDDIEGDEDV